MAAEAATLYKLMLLYLLNKVDFEMTNTQLTDFILEKQYTNYFHVQTALSELVEEDLCRAKKLHNSTYYKITEMGEKTIGFFKNDISESIRDEMDEYLREHAYNMKDESSIRCDYVQEAPEEYHVRCTLKENKSTLMDLVVNVTSESEARKVCDVWKKRNTDIYGYLMKTFLE